LAKTEDIMAGLVPERRSRQELNKANDLLLKEHRAYLASWKEAVTAPRSSERKADEHERSEGSSFGAKDD
jgi:hypothetical protein